MRLLRPALVHCSVLGAQRLSPVSERIRLSSKEGHPDLISAWTARRNMKRNDLFLAITTPKVYVGRWAKTLAAAGEAGAAEKLMDAVNAVMGYTSWYGLIIADKRGYCRKIDDWLKVAATIKLRASAAFTAITTSDPPPLTPLQPGIWPAS